MRYKKRSLFFHYTEEFEDKLEDSDYKGPRFIRKYTFMKPNPKTFRIFELL